MAYGVEGERRYGGRAWRGPAAGAGVATGLVLAQLALARFVVGVTIPDAAGGDGAVRAWSVPILAMCVVAGAAGGWAAGVLAGGRPAPRFSAGRLLASGLPGGVLSGLALLSVTGPGGAGVGLIAVAVLAVTAGAAYGNTAAGAGRAAAAVRSGLISGGAALWLGYAARRLAGVLLMPASPIDADGELTTAALHGLAHLRVWSPIAYGAGIAAAITVVTLTTGPHRTHRSPYTPPPATGSRPATAIAAATSPLALTVTATALAVPVSGTTATTIGSTATWAALTLGSAVGALTALAVGRAARGSSMR